MAKEPNGHRLMKNCLQCKIGFRTYPSKVKQGQGKYCSQECGREYRSEQAKIRNKRTCLHCNSEFIASIGNIKAGGGKYCSRLCQNKTQGANWRGKRKPWTEEWRKKLRLAAESRRGNPSPKKGKRYPHLQGENSHLWKGGISAPDKLERVRFRKFMQAQIFARDNYTCQICDEYGGFIQVDHIKSWAHHPELRFEPSNCRTLCMACHYYVTFKRKLPQGVVWGHNLNRRISK